MKVEWARAAPPFLKKATFGRFLMQVSMSASVTKPSLSTSIIFEYCTNSSKDRFFSTFYLRNSAKRGGGMPIMPGAAIVLCGLAAARRFRRAPAVMLFCFKK